MVAFANQHYAVMSKYHLIATGTTGQRINQATGLVVERMALGPLGGDTQISARVVTGDVAAVLFFVDPLYAQPHEPDIQALLRVCEVYNVPLATNLATADAVVAYLQKSRVGHLIFNPVAGQGNPDQDLALIRRLLEPQVQLNVIFTSPDINPAQQAQQAIADGAEIILASGGDGGDVLLIREPTELADGTIDPDYPRRPGGAGGGGSGGVVYLAAPLLEVRGRVEAAGGLGGRGESGSRTASNFGGQGAVGRIRLSTRTTKCVATGTFDPPLAGGRCLANPGAAAVPAVVEWPD